MITEGLVSRIKFETSEKRGGKVLRREKFLGQRGKGCRKMKKNTK